MKEVRAPSALRPGRAIGLGLVITYLLRIRTTGAAGYRVEGEGLDHFQPSDFPGGRPCGTEYRSPLPTLRERPGFSAGNTGKPDNNSSINAVFSFDKSFSTLFPESLSLPRLKLHGARAGAQLRRRPRDASWGSHGPNGRPASELRGHVVAGATAVRVREVCWPPADGAAGPTR